MLNLLVDWQFALQWLSLGFVAGTVVFGAAALIASRETNKRQAVQILTLEKDLSDAKRKQAEAEAVVATLGYQTSPRWAKFTAQSLGCRELIKELPPRKIDILHQDNSLEGYRLGVNVGLWLKAAKWDAPQEPRSVPAVMPLLPELAKLNWSDAVMLTRNGPTKELVELGPAKTPEVALNRCLGFSTYWDKGETLPENTIRLVITVP